MIQRHVPARTAERLARIAKEISRTGIFGDVFNAWSTVEFPIPGHLAILLGVDYDRWSLEESP